MEAIQGIPGFVVYGIIALGSLLLGHLIASRLYGRKSRDLSAQLEDAQARTSELQVSEGKLQEQLRAASEALHRTTEEFQESKQEIGTLRAKLEQATEFSHAAAIAQQTAQTENLATQARATDLTERLATAQDTCEILRAAGDRLKNDVAAQTQRAELAEASDREAREQLTTTRTALTEQRQVTDGLRADLDTLKDDFAEEGKRAKALEISEREVRDQLAEVKQTLDGRIRQHDALQTAHQNLLTQHTELKTTLDQRETHFKEQRAQLVEARQALTQEFENLANKIFEEKGKTFASTSQVGIDNLLKPFREQINSFQTRINEVHDASLKGNTSLSVEIRKVMDVGMEMSKEASNLASALKGNSQQRGAWGEAQLRRTLEMSGLIEKAHYEVQSAFKDAEGKQKQTDYLVKLPDGKHLIIDSKVSLVAYDRAVGAESPEAYRAAMDEHLKAVRKHIDDLASKDYTNLIGMRSPNFVLMFMPIEPAYIEALKSAKDLFEYGYNKGVVMVSHTTLIPILRTVANLWMIERSNAEAREISEKAGEIYNQVCLVAERLHKLGGTLGTVSNHYNDTVTALAGKQGLYGKVDRFNTLSTKVSKALPHLDAVHTDFEVERLTLIVEAVDEAESPSGQNLQLIGEEETPA